MNLPEFTPALPAPRPPAYRRTLLLAAALFAFDGLFAGQGFLSIFTLVVGVPGLLIRALLAWKAPALWRRRLASVAIYAWAALATLALVRFDNTGANGRAERLIAACEEFKKAEGRYPEKLTELTPKFISAIPRARHVGMRKDFTYLVSESNHFVARTNSHVLIYVMIQPLGKSFYVLEEKRWGFYD